MIQEERKLQEGERGRKAELRKSLLSAQMRLDALVSIVDEDLNVDVEVCILWGGGDVLMW